MDNLALWLSCLTHRRLPLSLVNTGRCIILPHIWANWGRLGQIGFLQIFDEAIRISRKTGKVGLFPKTDRVLPYSVQHSVQLWKTPL